MGETSIEWTRNDDGTPGKTWNPTRGCSLKSTGCTNCYAMKFAHRFSGKGQPYEGLTRMGANGPIWTGKIRLAPEMLDAPLKWKKPCRIFVNSMSDLFHEDLPDSDIDQVFRVMGEASRHTFQILTKRPDRMAEYVGNRWSETASEAIWRPLPNVWLGTSIENQATADERIPHLLRTPAVVRFLSVEPLLGPVDIYRYLFDPNPHREHWPHEKRGLLHWIIVGGESGPGARPMHPMWAERIRDQCNAANVPYFFKQWGEYGPEQIGNVRFTPVHSGVPMDVPTSMFKVGKKAAGRLLDGRTWDEFPKATVPAVASEVVSSSSPSDLPGQGLLFHGDGEAEDKSS